MIVSALKQHRWHLMSEWSKTREKDGMAPFVRDSESERIDTEIVKAGLLLQCVEAMPTSSGASRARDRRYDGRLARPAPLLLPADEGRGRSRSMKETVLETPDGRYIIVRGRLWRKSNPHLPEDERKRLVSELMAARRAVKEATGKPEQLRAARKAVDAAKVALGERGPVWWNDGAPDFNRHVAKNTPYGEDMNATVCSNCHE